MQSLLQSRLKLLPFFGYVYHIGAFILRIGFFEDISGLFQLLNGPGGGSLINFQHVGQGFLADTILLKQNIEKNELAAAQSVGF